MKSHQMSSTKIYRVWKDMKRRCNSPSSKDFKRYKGRGITYCESWELFENFYKDMGDIPKGKSLDRVNNEGNYSKENCRWATNYEQATNKSPYGKIKEKYIHIGTGKHKGYFIVGVKPFYNTSRKTLEEAIKIRDELVIKKENKMNHVTEIIVEARMPTGVMYGFHHVTIKSFVNQGDDLFKLRSELIALAEGVLHSKPPTAIQAYVEVEDAKSAERKKEVEEVEEAPKATKKKVKVKKAVNTAYDRENETMKDIFKATLTELFGTMKGLVGTKEASLELHGKDFLDEEGQVLQSAKDVMLEMIKKK